MKRVYETRGPGPNRTKIKPSPRHHEFPEGGAFVFIRDKRHKIRVLLDFSSNSFLLHQNTARTIKVRYEIRENPLKIRAFNGQISSVGGKYYLYRNKLEIGTEGHTTFHSSEIAEPGKYHIIIPFGWWHQEYLNKNIESPEKLYFDQAKCMEHIQDAGSAEML